MKRLLILVFFACSALLSRAQVSASEAMDIAAQKQRIHEQRATYEAQYAKEHAACFERFMVFDCQQEVKRAKRNALDELRHQEVMVNGLERRANADTTLQRINQNFSPDREAQRLEQQQRAEKDSAARRLRGFEKQLGAEKTDSIGTGGASGSALHQAPVSVNGPNSSEQEQRYMDKLKEAKQHKQEKAQSSSANGVNASSTLPIPAEK